MQTIIQSLKEQMLNIIDMAPRKYSRGEVIIGNSTLDSNTIRFDMEVVDGEDESTIYDLAMELIDTDIVDLLEDGDRNSNDVLLKVQDGRKKRGKELLEAYFSEAVVVEEPKPKKQSTEYAIYVRLNTEWEK